MHSSPHTDHAPDPQSLAVGHELRDTNVKPLVIAVLGLLVFLVLALGFIALGMNLIGLGVAQTGNTLSNDTLTQLQMPPAPRLEQNPLVDSARLVAEDRAQLHGYGWVDETAGSVHIPIERAMELLLVEGVEGTPAP